MYLRLLLAHGSCNINNDVLIHYKVIFFSINNIQYIFVYLCSVSDLMYDCLSILSLEKS